jgi:hypothetical protein
MCSALLALLPAVGGVLGEGQLKEMMSNMQGLVGGDSR